MAAARIMVKEAEEFGFMQEYREEIEFKFTLLFYINTLFSYMVGVRPVKLGFVRKMGKEMRKTFVNFQENSYYIARVNPEEKKLIKIQQSSTLLFVLYYKLLWGYRNWRKRK